MIDKIVSEDVKRIVTEINDAFLEGKDILVTGGAGFIGSYLCDVLVELGANVTCLDDFSTGLTVNIDHLFDKTTTTATNTPTAIEIMLYRRFSFSTSGNRWDAPT